MSYMSDLKKVRAEGLSIWRLAVANEVDYWFSSIYDEDKLEYICEFVYDWIMSSSNASPEDVCRALNTLFSCKEIAVDDIINNVDDVVKKVNEII